MAMDLEVCMYICSVSTYEHTNIAHAYVCIHMLCVCFLERVWQRRVW